MRKVATAAVLGLACWGLVTPAALAAPAPQAPPQDLQEATQQALQAATAITVYVTVDGKGSTHRVPRGTVQSTLDHLKISVGTQDMLSAPLTSMVTDKQFLTLEHHSDVSEVRTVALQEPRQVSDVPVNCGSPATVTTAQALLAAPKTKEVQQATPGTKEETWVKSYRAGRLLGEKKASERVVKPAKASITAPCVLPKLVDPVAPKAATPTAEPQQPLTSTPTAAPQQDDKAVMEAKLFLLGETEESFDYTSVEVPTDAPVLKSTGGTTGAQKAQWLTAAGIPASEWTYVDYIVTRESEWKPTAVNRSSGACSLVQSLPCSKIGPHWRDPVVALKWQKNYVNERYGGYKGAYAFWTRNHWY